MFHFRQIENADMCIFKTNIVTSIKCVKLFTPNLSQNNLLGLGILYIYYHTNDEDIYANRILSVLYFLSNIVYFSV